MVNRRAPTWASIYARWVTHEVQPIQVLSYDQRWSPRGECWTGKHGARAYPYQVGNPLRDVARRLVKGANRGEEEGYAAFLLFVFCTEHPAYADYGFASAVTNAARKFNEAGYWHATARRVMPGDNVPYAAKVTWEEAVDVAATAWKEIGERYAVVRIPNFMDFNSEEHRAYCEASRNAQAEENEERDRKEYARLKVKYEGG